MKCFLLILKVVDADIKIEILEKRVVNDADMFGDSQVVQLVPYMIELCIPFLKDENK